MKRSQRKQQLKAERAARRKDPQLKSGFRKLTIDGAVYQYKQGKQFTEIRVPGKLNLKWIVQNYQLQGFSSLDEWKIALGTWSPCGDPQCDYEECLKVKSLYAVKPGQVRKYIDEMRKVTCNEGGTCGCKK